MRTLRTVHAKCFPNDIACDLMNSALIYSSCDCPYLSDQKTTYQLGFIVQDHKPWSFDFFRQKNAIAFQATDGPIRTGIASSYLVIMYTHLSRRWHPFDITLLYNIKILEYASKCCKHFLFATTSNS